MPYPIRTFGLLLVPAKQLTISHLEPRNTNQDGVWTPRVEAVGRRHIIDNGDLPPHVKHSLIPAVKVTV